MAKLSSKKRKNSSLAKSDCFGIPKLITKIWPLKTTKMVQISKQILTGIDLNFRIYFRNSYTVRFPALDTGTEIHRTLQKWSKLTRK